MLKNGLGIILILALIAGFVPSLDRQSTTQETTPTRSYLVSLKSADPVILGDIPVRKVGRGKIRATRHLYLIGEAHISRFHGNDRVIAITPNRTIRSAALPNDPQFNQLWGLHNTGQTGGTPGADIHIDEAWDIQTGNPGIVAAVLDSGVDFTHPDLAGNMWKNTDEIPNNGLDDDGNGYVDDYDGWDFYNNDRNPSDDNGHGTHVSGVIGAVGNNGIGVSGVSQAVQIMPLKFIGSNNVGTIAGAIEAIEYAILMGADVLNNSWVISDAWGENPYSPPLIEAIEDANAAGLLFVAAVGNFQINTDVDPQYPASYANENIIAVTATDHNDVLASFANYGQSTVDLAAPGVDILSTVPSGSCKYCDPSGYKKLFGSSMSAAYVTGAVALFKAEHPSLNHLQIKETILCSGDPLPTLSGKTVSEKRLNAFGALTGDCIAPSAVTDLASDAVTPTAVRLAWSAPGDDGTAGTAQGYEIRYSTAPIDANNFDSATIVDQDMEPLPPGSNETLWVLNLLPDTEYFIALKAMDDAGLWGGLSNVVSFNTPAIAQEENLIVYLAFDDGTGSTATDSSGNGNSGMIDGALWEEGWRFGALDFDGDNDRVFVDPQPLEMENWGEITVAAWVKNDVGADAGTDDIVSWWDFPNSRSWTLTHHRTNQYFWEIFGKGTVIGGTVSTEWTHVVGTYDGAVMKLYVNGTAVANLPVSGGTLPYSTADMIIGGQANDRNYFDGLIDEVMIFNRALTDQEILSIFNGSMPGDLDSDGDVDGADLARLIWDGVPLPLPLFAVAFGNISGNM